MKFEPLDNLNGQTAVIVGAAGGIGFAICQTLARAGARVVGVVRRNPEDLVSRFLQLANQELGHEVVLADNTKTAEFADAVKHIISFDILVNTAGFSKTILHTNIDELTDEFFETMLTVNLRAVFSTIRTFAPILRKSPNAVIVNISSASALKPGHGSNMAYTAAKAGLESLTKNLAIAFAPDIRVLSICPSSMNTGFLDQTDTFYTKAAETTPLKRIAVPEDIASVVEACCTKLRFMTGNSLTVDGGRIL